MIIMENRHLYWRINKNKFLLFSLGLAFSAFFVTIPYLSDIFPLYKWLINYFFQPLFVILIFIYILIKKKKFTPNSLCLFGILLGLCSLMLFITMINKQNLIAAVSYAISILAIPLFFVALGPRVPTAVLSGISTYFRFVLICWFLTIILYHENGLYNFGRGRNYYFWGNVNSSIKMAMPAVAIFSVIDIWKHHKISKKTWGITLLVLAAQFFEKSYIAAIGMTMYVIVLVCFSLKLKIIRHIPRLTPLFLSLVILVCICLIQFSELQQLMRYVGLYFDRLTSITTRTIMWEQGLNAIKRNQLGYGYLTDFSKFIRLGSYRPTTAHNIYIDMAMQIGILGVIVFIVFIYSSIKFMPDWNLWGMIPASLFAYAVMWNFEPYFLKPHFNCFLILLFIFISLNSRESDTLIKSC